MRPTCKEGRQAFCPFRRAKRQSQNEAEQTRSAVLTVRYSASQTQDDLYMYIIRVQQYIDHLDAFPQPGKIFS